MSTLMSYGQFMGQLVTPAGESAENQASILTHAATVIQNLGLMRESALRICISLYQCKEKFVETGEEGWELFCDQNFSRLGIGQSNIRAAIRAGRGLTKYIETARARNENVDLTHFETMSRSALVLLGDADEQIRDELMTRVVEISSNGGAPTAREVQAEIERLKLEKAASDEQLKKAEFKLTDKEEALGRLNSLVRDREQEISLLNEKLEDLEASRKETPVVIEEADHESKRLRQEREAAEASLASVRGQLEKAKAQLEKENAAIEKANREAAKKQMAVDSVTEVEKQIEALKARLSEVLVIKIINTDPISFSPVFSRISSELRVLAAQIDPEIV